MELKTEETICAQSTPKGKGAISLIRISGSKALSLTRKVCPFLPKKPTSHRIYYGWIGLNHSKRKIDEVLVSYFEKGKSFTGEESLEISCHGNPNIVKDILEALVLKGVRLAQKGEFTYRAFMNGRMDLVQAEGLLGLIHSSNRKVKEVYLNQLAGGLSKPIRGIIEDLQEIHAHVEADIDFSEENLEIYPLEVLAQKGKAILLKINQFLDSFKKVGQFVREGGMKAFLIGPPNVGKSSLFNALLEKDQAIVTKKPGTTRDLLEGALYFGEIEGVLTDTAGLRETSEEVEKIGVHKVKEALLKKEGIFLFVLDLSRPILKEDLLSFKEFQSCLKPENTFVLGNKLDLLEVKKTQRDSSLKSENTFVLGNKLDLLEAKKTQRDSSLKSENTFVLGNKLDLLEVKKTQRDSSLKSENTFVLGNKLDLLEAKKTQQDSSLKPENTFVLGNKLDLLEVKKTQRDSSLKSENTFVLGNKLDLLEAKKPQQEHSSLAFKEAFKEKKRKKNSSADFLRFQFHKVLKEVFSSEEGEMKDLETKEEENNKEKRKEKLEIREKRKIRAFKRRKKEIRGAVWPKKNFMTLSATEPQSLLKLKKILKKQFSDRAQEACNPVTEVRQYELLLNSAKHLKKALRLIKGNEGLDLIAFELKESLLPLYELIGKEWDEQVVDRIFKDFCLGK